MASDADQPVPSRPSPARPPVVPAGTGTLGMWLFLASLFMLFASAMIAYAFIRLAGARSPGRGALHLPSLLWLSTALVIGVSFAMSRAVSAVRQERQQPFMTWTWASVALALGFLAVQTPAMLALLREHEQFRSAGIFLYGLVFVLILLHALHVVGGMAALGRIVVRGSRGAYDHEHYQPVRHAAMYWHFLDLIWILMFVTFLLTD